MPENIWWVTRPTRDLHDLVDALGAFAKIATNQKWKGAKSLHQRFEKENPAKTSNVGKHMSRGSGGRTWAAWLRMWGMWYNDECVTITDAGKMILNPSKPEDIHKQIVHMIMTFQITSAYHSSLNAGKFENMKIFPFRFMLKLILDRRIKFLSIDEIMLFLLNVKSEDEYNGVVSQILDWREKTFDHESRKKLTQQLLEIHMEKHHKPRSDSPTTLEGYKRSIRDIAQTLAINISYIIELEYNRKLAIVCIRKDNMQKIDELFRKYQDNKFSTLYTHSEATFMRRFGIRYDRRKSSGKDTSPMTRAKKETRKILVALNNIRKNGDKSEGSKLVEQIRRITNYPDDVITKVLSENRTSKLNSSDEDEMLLAHYLECGRDGSQHAEFEKLTRRIFEMMDYKTYKMRVTKKGEKSKVEIDGLIMNKNTNMSGLLECKAGAMYALSNKDASLMTHDYIGNFKTKKKDGIKYELDFFVYVIGHKFTGLDNFRGIIKNSKIRGSVIYAHDLFILYQMFCNKKISGAEIWSLFKCGRVITEADIR